MLASCRSTPQPLRRWTVYTPSLPTLTCRRLRTRWSTSVKARQISSGPSTTFLPATRRFTPDTRLPPSQLQTGTPLKKRQGPSRSITKFYAQQPTSTTRSPMACRRSWKSSSTPLAHRRAVTRTTSRSSLTSSETRMPRLPVPTTSSKVNSIFRWCTRAISSRTTQPRSGTRMIA